MKADKDLSEALASGYTLRDVADWMFSVDHVRLEYGIRYRGTDLRFLSPGTRGIVLLVLYLALDTEDSRPLIIDQPEENLDNQSIYDVLTHYFRSGKERRQVIMVTHNPNLVVNTDAEQVIVATLARRDNGLPTLSYVSGPLEAAEGLPEDGPSIRDQVCRILEGGEDAFVARERKYRTH